MPRQPKSFDPRQVMQKLNYEIQYKKDVSLKDVELHHHDFHEIYFLLSGDVTYLIEGKLVHVMPGDLLLISPHQLHQVCIRPEMSAYERYVLWVDSAYIHKLSSEISDLYQAFNPEYPGYGNQYRLKKEERTKIQRLLDELSQNDDSDAYGSDLLRSSILTQLLVYINRLVHQQGPWLDEDSRTSRAVTQAMQYINLHYNEPMSLETLAEQFFVSKYHLSHSFQRQVGTSLYQYIQKKRLLIARQLLSQGKKPSKIYAECGFNDYAGFYRAFKAEYGISPREYMLLAKQSSKP